MSETKAQWLRMCILGTALVATPIAAASQNPSPMDLYRQGESLYQQGRLLEAKETLARIDLAQIERAQRIDIQRINGDIDSRLSSMSEIELRLAKAALDIEHGSYRQAESHLTSALDNQQINDAQISEAQAMLTRLREAQDDLRPQIDTILNQALIAYEQGNFGAAKEGLLRVHHSGLSLDLDQEAELHRRLQRILTLEAEQGFQFNGNRVNLVAMSALAMQDPAQEDPLADPVEQPEEDEPQDEPEAEEVQPAEQEFVPPTDLIFQAQQAQAANLIREAQVAEAEGRYNAAEALYQRVLSIQPDNEVAQQGLAQVQTMLNRGPLEMTQPLDVLAQQLRAEFENLMDQAQGALNQGDFNDAQSLTARASNIVQDRRRYVSQEEYEELIARTDEMFQAIDAAEASAEAIEAQEQQEEIERARLEERLRLEQEKQRRINEKLLTIRRYQMAQKYEEALLELDSLLFMDPNNPAAIALRETIQEILIFKRYDELKRDQELRWAGYRMDLLEAQRMPIDIVEYPEDWPALTVRRADAFAFSDSENDRAVWQALASHRVPVNFNGAALGDVINFVGEVAQINVDVDWRALEENFIDRNTPVNLKLNDNVPLQVVLDRVLDKVGDDELSRPDYEVSDGILTISTRERLQRRPVTHVYDIKDLLIDIPNFDNAPDFDLDSILAKSQGSNYQDRVFGSSEDETDYDRGELSRDQRIEDLRTVLTSSIDPRSWQLNGGELGVVQELNGNFIITTTTQNHRDISNLLGKLREIRSLQINVESRFLLVTEEFFEQIGFDLDVYYGGSAFEQAAELDENLLPSDLFIDRTTNSVTDFPQRQFFSLYELVPAVDPNTGLPIRDAQRRQLIDQDIPDAGIFQAGRDTWSPWSIQQNSLSLAETLFSADASTLAGQALSASPAATFGITYLDEIQVDLLIEATQADQRNVQLTAPRLTFFNGQRSFVQLTTSRFFVSDLQPVVGEASAGFDPTLSPLREGVVLDVEGTVSADRRYVTMTVLTSLAQVLDIQTTSIPIVVGGQVVISDPEEGGPTAGDILSNEAVIERPTIQISRVNTSVTVPDKGTILLGGQSVKSDIEIETGVPVLSKIPILNRFFTNRIMTTESRTLLILMKPTIIIQQENEELLFPGLRDAAASGASYGSPM